DCIVLDGLGQLTEPESLLAQLGRHLTPEGICLAEVPNLRHHEVLRNLLEGAWRPNRTSSETVRFFTRRELEKLFSRSELRVETITGVPSAGHAEWVAQGRPAQVT